MHFLLAICSRIIDYFFIPFAYSATSANHIMDNAVTMSQLDQLIENSRANEAIAQKLFDIETAIIACQTSKELLQQLLTLIKKKFDLTHIHLLLADPAPLNYLITSGAQSTWHKTNTTKLPAQRLELLHPDHMPLLTNNMMQFGQLLPPSLLQATSSAAFTPLMLEGKLFGSLIFIDNNKERFNPALGTYHLKQLGTKVSLCLSNVLIREQLEYMANFDGLTGVGNRRLLEKTLLEELNRHQRYSVPFSILFIDCNKFKQLNDTYGHDCGDKVLHFIATQLKALIRDNDRCFRYAGDEFVVTLASQGANEAKLAAKRLIEHFEHHHMIYQEKKLEMTISCGIATSDGEMSIEQLLKAADEQLYRHKKQTISYEDA